MSETKDQAQTATETARTAIQTAENTQFIANVDAQIAAASAQGHFFTSAITSPNVDIQAIFTYYSNLGYAVSFPDHFANPNTNPVQLFGQYWTDYWLGILTLYPLKNPARVLISWR